MFFILGENFQKLNIFIHSFIAIKVGVLKYDVKNNGSECCITVFSFQFNFPENYFHGIGSKSLLKSEYTKYFSELTTVNRGDFAQILNFKYLFFFLKEVRNATEAHIALMRGSPCVPRTLQMQLMRINICRVLRRWNQFICWK